jgi:hypothetical protein
VSRRGRGEEPTPEVIGSIIDVERMYVRREVSLLVERATDDQQR